MPLDLEGAAANMIHLVAHLKPEWMIEEYGKELEELFAAHRTREEGPHQQSPEYPVFADKEIAQLLLVYEQQIAAIRTLLDDHSDMRAAESKYNESKQIREQLNALSFVRIDAQRGGPFRPPWFVYVFFDETREFMAKNEIVYSPYCHITKIGTDLDIGGPQHEDWRIGLCQIWIERRYCKPDCTAILEFRIDAEIGGEPHEFKIWIQLLDEIADINQCFGSLAESPTLDW